MVVMRVKMLTTRVGEISSVFWPNYQLLTYTSVRSVKNMANMSFFSWLQKTYPTSHVGRTQVGNSGPFYCFGCNLRRHSQTWCFCAGWAR